ncbi:hydrolase 1, exosortase A system-associated [Sphingomonas oligophenolica]|uniref:Hydrolase 1, exosortase A system-associated n=1 Tax=Sphingomonas oligophenolica TaxID=301154 RepID=A0A502CF87_9SPHN|nr:hydrolase 1, exosortase A system-associated [Sphingomonas oligophenolica]TPG12375.1 hydrolase 1, exosortase A system-associated [Sphingomonas oligophenolica]
MRRLIAFPCAGDTLIGAIDDAAATTGLLIVSGGNEVRAGAHRGMAMLAANIAAAGFPVLRYDRRGVGDSAGENRGFRYAQDDLAAAVATFRAEVPGVDRIVGFGNCDAASTLALFGRDAGIDRVLLANPWVIEDDDDLPPAAAIRARYAERLRSRSAWSRLLRGEIDLRKTVRGLAKLSRTKPHPSNRLATRVIRAIADWDDDATVILASGDATAIAYRDVARGLPATTIDTDSHSFARSNDKEALRAEVVNALRR